MSETEETVQEIELDGAVDSASVEADNTELGTNSGWSGGGEMLYSEELYSLHRPESIAAETISGLRNHLVTRHYAQHRRSLAICSPTAGAGTDVIAANLSIALAQSGLRTLLIDANLREPHMQDLFNVGHPVEGLTEFLGKRTATAPKLFGEVVPNLAVMFAGTGTDNSAGLLASVKFKSMIEESIRSFDITIIDCPPSANYSDSRRIATLVRNALIIARKDHTFAADVKMLVDELKSDGVQIVGTLLNASA